MGRSHIIHLTSCVGVIALEIKVTELVINVDVTPLQFDGHAQDVVRDAVLHEPVDLAVDGGDAVIASAASLREQSLDPHDDVGRNLSLR